MSADNASFLNIVPTIRIKKEKVYDDEDAILCKFCMKGFASTMALTNHARMEHFDEYAAGEQLAMEAPPKPVSKKEKIQQREETKKQIKIKTEELISTMSPTNLTTFASPDVSYIIIKGPATDDGEGERQTVKERVRKPGKIVVKDDTVSAIAGPFECLHPSNQVADGVCHQIFFSCCEYSAHYRDEHTRRRKGLRCQVCEKPLFADSDMPHCCEQCGSGFKTSDELTAHVRTAHVKLKPYQCHVCQKRFTQLAGLQQHMRMHTGDRPYPCTFCSKAFTQKSGLEQHLRIHTKERPYRCVICSKSFCQSIHLKQHMRTHTNVAPFECGLCQKRFKQSSHLNYHLKCHNPAKLTEEQKGKYHQLLGLIGGVEYEVLDTEDTNIQVEEEYVFTDCSVLEED